MTDHKAQPIMRGGRHFCRECGGRVIHYRPTKLIPKTTWRHASWRQETIGESRAIRSRLGLI
jgi:hypothetical protein